MLVFILYFYKIQCIQILSTINNLIFNLYSFNFNIHVELSKRKFILIFNYSQWRRNQDLCAW